MNGFIVQNNVCFVSHELSQIIPNFADMTWLTMQMWLVRKLIDNLSKHRHLKQEKRYV